MRLKYSFLALSLLVSGAAMANGAAYIAPAPSASQWSLYGGVQGGIDTLQVNRDVNIATTAFGITSKTTASYEEGDTSGVGGIFIGLNYQASKWFAIALEADANYDSAKANVSITNPFGLTGNVNLSEQVKHSYGISFIPSIAFSKLAGSSVFARIGYTMGDFEVNSVANAISDQGFTGHVSKNLDGLTLGLGVNIPLHDHLGMRLEYDYTSYDAFNRVTSVYNPQTLATTVTNTRFDPHTNEVLVSLYYNHLFA